MIFDVSSVPAFAAWQTGEPRNDGLTIYAPDQIAERNEIYEVAIYLPGHLMIGDDSGGRGVLLDSSGAVWIAIWAHWMRSAASRWLRIWRSGWSKAARCHHRAP